MKNIGRREFLKDTGKGLAGLLVGATGLNLIGFPNTAFGGKKKECKIYTYNYWIDENGDDSMKIPGELKGRKDSFAKHERIEIGVSTINYRGAKLDVGVYDSSGQKVFGFGGDTVSRDNEVRRVKFPSTKQIGGTYTITAEINGIAKARKEFNID